MQKTKPRKIPPKLTDPEQDLLRHLQQGYQLETDARGGNPVLRRLKDNDVVRAADANANTIRALNERGLIKSAKGRQPLTLLWRLHEKSK